MPSYAFLKDKNLDIRNFETHLVANRRVGVPYTDEMVENAVADLQAQADPNADTSGVEERYPKAKLGDFDGDPNRLTEMDALVAYLQLRRARRLALGGFHGNLHLSAPARRFVGAAVHDALFHRRRDLRLPPRQPRTGRRSRPHPAQGRLT
jgi:hypothetical protein